MPDGELFGLPEVPDPELVDKIKCEALIRAGYAITNEDGESRASFPLLQRGVLQNMHERHVVRNKRDFITGAVTRFELYQEMLPDAPGAQSLAATPEEKLAQEA